MRIRGMEALRKWIGEDEGLLRTVAESELVRKCVSILGKKTIEEKGRSDGKRDIMRCGVGRRIGSSEGERGGGCCSCGSGSVLSGLEDLDGNGGREREEEGVSVVEKNGILGIVLEVVEGGGWIGEYSELEEVVGMLEEEGEKECRERKRKGGRGWSEWKEMGRLAHDVVWEIEKKKKISEGGEDECGIISVLKMKKELEEEKKRAEEEKRKREESEQRMNAEKNEEKRLREQSEKRLNEEKKRADGEKRELEQTIHRLEAELENRGEEQRRKQAEEENRWRLITSLDGPSVTFPKTDNIKREGNTIIHHGSGSYRNCFIGGVMTSV